eukprot:TRINITY_DN2523_c0_g1_i8.p2 TRINITY_DN2523_c0_g1~~TRINITY_DN2523_c0_g1_i8.p2  ORF type:complete len:199 (+),score=23.22 TRINITY_DN2523_c0_g1_i8:297-893(+)
MEQARAPSHRRLFPTTLKQRRRCAGHGELFTVRRCVCAEEGRVLLRALQPQGGEALGVVCTRACQGGPMSSAFGNGVQVVRGVVERAMRRGYRVVVGFEEGATEFDCDFAAAIHDNMVTGEGYGLVSSMSAAVKQHGRIEDDVYQRALQESLLQLADIGRLQNKGLEQHMEDLDEMEQQLPNLLDSVTRHNDRVRNIR